MILRNGEVWTSADQPKEDDLKTVNVANVVTDPISETNQLFQFILNGDELSAELIDNFAGEIANTRPSQAVIPPNRFVSMPWENDPADILLNLINKEHLSTQKMSRFV